MPSKRRLPFRLIAMIAAPLVCVAIVLVASLSLAHAAPAPSASSSALNRFYSPRHHANSKPPAAIPLSTRNNLRHGPGPVMHTTTTYAIFWEPSHLQDGSSSSVVANYNSLLNRFLGDVGGTTFYNILTQYYDVNNAAGHIQNVSTFGGSYVDTSAYPAANADCRNQGSATPVDCIGDAQTQSEITKAMGINGWTKSASKLFILFIDPGEDECSSIVGGCFTTVFCAFHFYYGSTNQPYAMMPYGGTGQGCDAGQPSPNNNTDADYEISTMAHELFEAASDPLPNQNWTGPLGEIGDACAYNYGSFGQDGGRANESLHGHFYTTQMMWDNKIGNCAQTGP